MNDRPSPEFPARARPLLGARATASLLLLVLLATNASAEWTIPIDQDVETGIVDVHVHEDVTLQDVDDPQETLAEAPGEVQQAVDDAQTAVNDQVTALLAQAAALEQQAQDIVNGAIATAHEIADPIVADAQAQAQGLVDQATALKDQAIALTNNGQCKRFTETTPGNGDTFTPPGAAGLGGQGLGFIPGCVIMDTGFTFTYHGRDPVPHNPGSLGPGVTAGAGPSGPTRCFQRARDNGATLGIGTAYPLQWHYDGTDTEVSSDGGVTWRNCNTAVDTAASDANNAVIPYRCDIHAAMTGKIVVHRA